MNKLGVLAAGLAMGMAAPAMAVTLTVTSISGSWIDSTPTVNGIGSNKISWGTPTSEGGPSSYVFTPAATDLVVEDGEEFVLGTFTHNNFPIRDVLLEEAVLDVAWTIKSVGSPLSSVFVFDHWETPNQVNPCADGGAFGVGVNASGCADRVTAVSNPALSETVTIDGVEYALSVTGFRYGGNALTEFWTQERRSNSAQLLGIFEVVGGDGTPTPPVSEVPLPATALLLLGALAGLRTVGRRT